jgi:hypothetical protein
MTKKKVKNKKKNDSLSGAANAQKRVSVVRESSNVENDWNFNNAINADVIKAMATIPASVDLRRDWWKIADQGRSNSCVGFVVADSVARWHLVEAKRLDKTKMLSSRYVWMAAKEIDQWSDRPGTFIEWDGTSIKTGLDVARKFGLVEEEVLPFQLSKFYEGEGGDFYALAARLKISSYFNLGVNISEWRHWLATKGPIAARVIPDQTWHDAKKTNGNLDAFSSDTANGAHAVCICGFTPDRFIVRNSWGEDWGDKGYGYASLNYMQAAFTEAFGINL